MAWSIPRYTYYKPLRVKGEQHISFKRPDETMRRANMAMKKDSSVITVDIDDVGSNKPPWKVAKMLTDTGSSIGIRYLGTLKKMVGHRKPNGSRGALVWIRRPTGLAGGIDQSHCKCCRGAHQHAITRSGC